MSLEELLNERNDPSPLARKCRQRATEIDPKLSPEEQEKVDRKEIILENTRLKLCTSRLSTFREELDAKITRLKEFMSGELNWENVAKEVLEKVIEFEELLQPHFREGVRTMLRLPEPNGIINEYHRQVLASQILKFETTLQPEEEQLQTARQEFNEYERQEDRKWVIFSNFLKKTELAEIRVEAYHLWVKLEQGKLIAKGLKVAREWVKREIWERIVSHCVNFTVQLQKTTSSPDAYQKIAKAVLFFAPFSTSVTKKPVQVKELSSSGNSRRIVMITKASDLCDSTSQRATSSESPDKSAPGTAQRNPSEQLQTEQFKKTSPVKKNIPEKKTMNFSIESILGTTHSESTKIHVERKPDAIPEPFTPQLSQTELMRSSDSQKTSPSEHTAPIPELPSPIYQRKRPHTSPSLPHDFKRSHLEPPAQYPMPSPDDLYSHYNQYYNMAPPHSVNNNWTSYTAQGYQGY